MIYNAGTISFSGNTVTGNGTSFTAPASQIRIGQTLLIASNPVQLVQITAINSATSLTVTPAAAPAVSGQKYAILVTDSLSVDGLAQSISLLINEYDENIGAWEAFASTSANQSVTVTINGQSITIPAVGKLLQKGSNGALAVKDGGTGANDAAGARSNLGLGYGTTAGTVAAGDDSRFNTIDGKTGGVIKGGTTVTPVSGDLTGPRSFIGAGSLDLYASSLPNVAFYYGNAATYTSRFIEASAGVMALQAGGGIARLRVEGGIVCRAGLTGVSRPNCFNFDFSGGTLLYIDQTLIGSVNTSSVSDKRLKKEVVYQDDSDNIAAYEQVMQWRPATYRFKARGELIPESDTKLGIIANDLVEISPECVDGHGLDDSYDGINPYNAFYLDHDAMLMKLTMAIQHQSGLIEKLQSEIQELKSGS
ncbi:tail fiber domain-containing protein [Enterobacter sp. ENT03]|uniref:tail fiber domain-containing protein n=1 Tax=Enterobacter sp. ENT03 TaxID=2854780 RepID=UPI001C496B5C|nr:tail fiber domain-containing protein [Enterobacter sp. ENT03]MBV7404553.1 tail fiber domain-containing protein [Enterobacter sp. ENT03]